MSEGQPLCNGHSLSSIYYLGHGPCLSLIYSLLVADHSCVNHICDGRNETGLARQLLARLARIDRPVWAKTRRSK